MSAQESISDRDRFALAVANFQAGRFEVALEDFQLLHASMNEPALLYNIARCHEELGHTAEAIAALEGYLESVPSGRDREDALQRLVRLERRRSEELEARAQAEPPDEVEAERAPEEGTVEPGDSASSAEPETTSSDRAPADDGGDDGAALTAGAIASFAVAGLALAAGTTLGVMTIGEHDELSSSCAPTCEPEQLGDLHAFGTGADIALGVSLGAAALGLVLTLLELGSAPSSDAEAPSARWRGLGLEGTF